jgi:hypothetical protein
MRLYVLCVLHAKGVTKPPDFKKVLSAEAAFSRATEETVLAADGAMKPK